MKKLMAALTSDGVLLALRILGAIGGVLIAVFFFTGKAAVNQIIAESPAVKASMDQVSGLSRDLGAVKVVADTANSKAAQLVDTQARIFEAIKDQGKTIQSAAVQMATIGQKVDGLSQQLTRVENMQDRTH